MFCVKPARDHSTPPTWAHGESFLIITPVLTQVDTVLCYRASGSPAVSRQDRSSCSGPPSCHPVFCKPPPASASLRTQCKTSHHFCNVLGDVCVWYYCVKRHVTCGRRARAKNKPLPPEGRSPTECSVPGEGREPDNVPLSGISRCVKGSGF